ncbi:MAG TPA: MFS transporter [Blastocatellia bacterium]|nr:MFS transporter [Blastocatellia bacterium]
MPASRTGQASAKAASVPARAGVVMAILFLIFFLGNSDNQMVSPLLPLIAGEFSIDVGRVGGLMIPAYALAAATAALLVGPLSDKFGRRNFLLLASVLFSVSLLSVFLIRDARVLAASRVLTGLASGTFSTCSIAYVANFFPYNRRGTAMSVVQAGYFAALVVGVPVASVLAQWLGWRTSFAFFGALALVAFALVLFLLPEDRHLIEEGLSTRVARRFDNIRVVFETRERVAGIVAAFLVSAGFVGFFSYLGSWLQKSLGLKTREVGFFFIIVGVAALIGALAAGPVADRFGKQKLSIASTIVLASMLFVIPRFGWGVALFASFLTASLAFAFRQGPLQALATQLVPSRVQGAFVAVRNTASQIGIAVSAAVSGLLYNQFGYVAVGVFSGVVTLGAAVCIFIMKEPAGDQFGHERQPAELEP